MTHHWEQQKSTFGYPQNPHTILNIVGEGMFEWAVISKSIIAQKGNCFENMPLLFSHKYQTSILSSLLVTRCSEIKLEYENQNAKNSNILTAQCNLIPDSCILPFSHI